MPARMPKSTRKSRHTAPTGQLARRSFSSRSKRGLPSIAFRAKEGGESGIRRKVSAVEKPKRKWFFPTVATMVVAVTLALFAVNLVTTNSLATQGGSSGDVNTEIAQLRTENANLEAQSAALTSVSRIYNEALARGYVQPDKVMYAAPASPVALKP